MLDCVAEPPFWVGDRQLTADDLELIRWTTDRLSRVRRWELAQAICENLAWKARNGRVHSRLVLPEQVAAAGQLVLPAKQAQGTRCP
jgi:hypothetical protein